MRNLKTVLSLCILLFVAQAYAQIVDRTNKDFTWKEKSQFGSELLIFGSSNLQIHNQYANHGYAHLASEAEIRLIYTKDQMSDIAGRIWTYELQYVLQDQSGAVIGQNAISVNNTNSEAKHKAVIRYPLLSNITDLTLEITSQNASGDVPDDIRLELLILHDNHISDLMTVDCMPILTPEYAKNEIDGVVEGKSTLLVEWESSQNALYYDLAYTFIDSEDNATYNSDAELFDQSVRVETDKNWMELDISYPRGTLYVWVRPVGYIDPANDPDLVAARPWELLKKASIAIQEVGGSLVAHEADKNWSFQTSFAEEGKYKKVMQYFDNSLRSQQTLTYLNDESTTLISETDYDHEGRQAVQILPAPSKTQANNLYYQPEFNRTILGDPYDATHFDQIEITSLGSQSGAGLYYSSENIANQDLAQGLHNGFIPDALGYPVVQTKYTTDNTQRVISQGGVGAQYQIGTGHETKYYYSNPSPTELRRLFGSDIGDAKHYKKVYTVDPNGQTSTSITDIQGNVVATALVGDSPENVLPLNSNRSALQLITFQLVTEHVNDGTIIASTNTYYKDDDLSETIGINYLVNPQKKEVVLNGVTHCLECAYKLTIAVYDECNVQVAEEIKYHNNQEEPLTVGPCPGFAESLQLTLNLELSRQGTYTIVKTLETLNPEFYGIAPVLSDLIDIDQITTTVTEHVDDLSCYLTCEHYCSEMFAGGMVTSYDVCLEQCEAQGLIDASTTQCEILFDNITMQINSVEQGLLIDDGVILNFLASNYDWSQHLAEDVNLEIIDITGEVFILFQNVDGDWYPFANNQFFEELQLFGEDNTVVTISFDGSLGPLALLFDRSGPSAVWQDQFAQFLAPAHREFCHVELCRVLEESRQYEYSLLKYESLKDIFLAKSIPFGPEIEAATIQNLIVTLISEDPFFPNLLNCNGSTAEQRMLSLLEDYESIAESPTDFCSVVSDNTADCDFYHFAAYMIKYLAEEDDFPQEATQAVWNLVYTTYTTFKQTIIEDQDCRNGCNFSDAQSEYTLITQSLASQINSYEEIMEVVNTLHNDIQPLVCEEREEVYTQAFVDLYGLSETTVLASTYQADLDQYCVNQCTFLEGSCSTNYTANNQIITTNNQGCSYEHGPAGFMGFIIPEDHYSSQHFTLIPYDQYPYIDVLDNVPFPAGFDTDQCEFTFNKETENMVFFKEGRVPGKRRVVVHINDCRTEEDLEILGVVAYSAICVPNSSSTIYKYEECSQARNIHGDIIIEWEPDTGPHNYLGDVIRVYALNADGKTISIQYNQDYDYQVPQFYYYNTSDNVIHLRDLQDVYNTMVELCPEADCDYTTPEAKELITDIWDCEKTCGNMDPCMETILDDIITFFNYELVIGGATHEVTSFGEAGDCYTEMKFHFFKDNCQEYRWYIEVYGSPYLNNLFNTDDPYVVFRLLSEDGLTPALCVPECIPDGSDLTGGIANEEREVCNVTIENYRPSNMSYAMIDLNVDQAKVLTPKIKFLFKTKAANAHQEGVMAYFQTVYLAIENKSNNASIEIVTDCETPITIPDLADDCMEELSEYITDLVTEEIQLQQQQYMDIILNADCLDGINETYSLDAKLYEHHYTLYYYDLLGNIVKTVPPAGVRPVPSTNFNANGVWDGTEPKHLKTTEYTYNSHNQMLSSDTPDAGKTTYIYDDLQRMRFSQNAEQQNGKYSYTNYDDLSRVVEVGEVSGISINAANAQNDPLINDPAFPGQSQQKVDINKHYYSDYEDTGFDFGVNRNRIVVSKRIYEKEDDDNILPVSPTVDDNVTYYSYDIHGNVKQLRQYIGKHIKPKTVNYSYDLISGNVKDVGYNLGHEDQFYYKYTYDADNRIRQSYSSMDGMLWSESARYFYYLHGPLARAEYGDRKVQGLDYTYTLQGWIKSGNLPVEKVDEEPGMDGSATLHQNSLVGLDATSYLLSYNTQDYVPISGQVLSPQETSLWTSAGNSILGNGLYNGNIAAMINSNHYLHQPLAYGYQYDQLHRINSGSAYLDQAGQWTGASYNTSYTYDPDGNLSSLERNNPDQQGVMDLLSYTYPSLTSPQPNALQAVTDIGDAGTDQVSGVNSYKYDAIGNLVNDIAQGTSIDWDVYNKVNSVTAASGRSVDYSYDAAGNRVVKNMFDREQTIYVRDAQGNILSTYTTIEGNLTQKEVHLYGSSRLGVLKTRRVEDVLPGPYHSGQLDYTQSRYELSNHLGNVLTTVTGRREGQDDDGNKRAESYAAEIASAQDYYPFGQTMPDRSMMNAVLLDGDHRFGFNGKEQDNSNEWGRLTHYDYGFRIYNPGIAKFLSVDPLTWKYPMLTSYQFASNRPIDGIDIDGKEWGHSTHASDVRWNETVTNKDVLQTSAILATPVVVVADVFTLKGLLTKQFLTSLGVQIAGNVATEVIAVRPEELSFNSLMKKSFNSTDIGDVLVGSVTFSKHSKVIDIAFKSTIQGAVDITPDDLKVLGFNKSIEEFGLDAFVAGIANKSGVTAGAVSGIIKKIIDELEINFEQNLESAIQEEVSVNTNQVEKIDNTRINIMLENFIEPEEDK